MLLGKKYVDSYNTIACSGAKIGDITNSDPKYGGQTTLKVEEGKRGDKNLIFDAFIPGELNQNEFATRYTPESVLLSISGNDIGFTNILKECVAPQRGGNTCYSTYEDRAELVNLMNRQYSRLVDTYKSISSNANGAKVYVVGYPQVVKPNGNCGANVHMNAAETVFASQLITYLNSVISAAASAAGVQYIDVQHAFDGYRLCEAPKGKAAMNGVTAGNDVAIRGVKVIGLESFHPTQFGHRLLADTIASATDNLTKAMPTATDFAQPMFDATLDFLTAVPKTGREVNLVFADDQVFGGPIILHSDTQQIMVQGTDLLNSTPNLSTNHTHNLRSFFKRVSPIVAFSRSFVKNILNVLYLSQGKQFEVCAFREIISYKTIDVLISASLA